MASDDNSNDDIHLDWRDDEVSLVNNTYKLDAGSPFEDDDNEDALLDDEDDDDEDADGSYGVCPEVIMSSGNQPLGQVISSGNFNDSHSLLTDVHHGYKFDSDTSRNQASYTDGRQHITISSSTSNSAASRFALAQQNYTQAEYEFTPEEIAEMIEKTRFELRRERRQKQGDVMKSPFIQEKLKKIRFFPDPTLNQLMSRLLQRLHYVKEALRVTMYIFFDVAMFKEYYVPSPSGPSGISSNKPFPKYERFHAFWSSIHCNDTSFCAKYTKGCIDANSNYRKIALTGGEYTGYVSHRGNISTPYEIKTSNPPDLRENKSSAKRSILEGPSSSKRFQVALSPTAKSSMNPVNPQRTLVADQVSYDSNGRAFYPLNDGEKQFIKDAPDSYMTAEQFYSPSRLLCMKGRAHHIWMCCKHRLLQARDMCWFSGASMADVAERVQNLNHFPDECLNNLVKRLLNNNLTLPKALIITMYVFFSHPELSKESVPPSVNFEHVSRPPVQGYEWFHAFWNCLLDTDASVERKKRFEGAINEATRFLSSSNGIPELPY